MHASHYPSETIDYTGKYAGGWKSANGADRIFGDMHFSADARSGHATAALEYTGSFMRGLKRALDFEAYTRDDGGPLTFEHRPEPDRGGMLGDQRVLLELQGQDPATGCLYGTYRTSIPRDEGEWWAYPAEFDEEEVFIDRTPIGAMFSGVFAGMRSALGM
jgi:hypothetical protein